MITGLKPILVAAIAAKPDAAAQVCDLDTGPDASSPSVWITDGPTSLGSRMVSPAARGTTETARLVCTSSSATGATALAAFVALTLDGQRLDGALLRCPLVTEALEDRTDPTEYRWSSSVDVERTTPRRNP